MTLNQTTPSCPVCNDPVCQGSIVACSKCGVPHHGDCWSYNEGCGIFACGNNHPGQLESLCGKEVVVISPGLEPENASIPIQPVQGRSRPSAPGQSMGTRRTTGVPFHHRGLPIPANLPSVPLSPDSFPEQRSGAIHSSLITPTSSIFSRAYNWASSLFRNRGFGVERNSQNRTIQISRVPVPSPSGTSDYRNFSLTPNYLEVMFLRDNGLVVGTQQVTAPLFGGICRVLYRGRNSLSDSECGSFLISHLRSALGGNPDGLATESCLVCNSLIDYGQARHVNASGAGPEGIVHALDTGQEQRFHVTDETFPIIDTPQKVFKALFGYDLDSSDGEELVSALCWVSNAPGLNLEYMLQRSTVSDPALVSFSFRSNSLDVRPFRRMSDSNFQTGYSFGLTQLT